ncbi:hypothetical protein GBAR_LOCUS5675, partial [Geodia barretti]
MPHNRNLPRAKVRQPVDRHIGNDQQMHRRFGSNVAHHEAPLVPIDHVRMQRVAGHCHEWRAAGRCHRHLYLLGVVRGHFESTVMRAAACILFRILRQAQDERIALT